MTCCNRNCRQGRDCEEQRPSMLASRGFWIGAILALVLWACAIAVAIAIYLQVAA